MQDNKSFDVGKTTLIISYFSQFFQYGISLLILPVVLRFLDSKDLGLWYIFLSIGSLVSLLDFGFGPSIQRNVAYVASGAKELLPDGVETKRGEGIDEYLFLSLLKTSRNIYKKISLGIIIAASTIGSVYLFYSLGDQFSIKILFIWFLYSISLALYFYYSYILSFVKGLGLIASYNKNIIISKSAYIAVLALMILGGAGLLSLVVSYIVNCFIMIILGVRDIQKVIPNFTELHKEKKYDNLFSVLWKNAKNSGIVSIGVFLLSQSGIFLSGLFLNIEEVAQLGLLLQLYGILVVLSRVYLTTCMPYVSSLWIKNEIGEIKKTFFKCQLACYLIYFLGVTVILFAGNSILVNIIHSNVLLPSSTIILLYGAFYFMEITHGNCCSLIATSNKIPFTRASIASGMISIIMTIVFFYFDLGMISLPLALICGSLPYNSWRWPLYTYKLLKLS